MGLFEALVNQLRHHTIVGRMITEGKSLGDAIKDDLSEDTIIGRVVGQDESIFEAGRNALKNNTPLGLLFGTEGSEEGDDGTSEGFFESLGDRFTDHTIVGRMITEGKSLGDAIKEDFMEDTIIGRLISGDNVFEAIQGSAKNRSIVLSSLYGNAELDSDKDWTDFTNNFSIDNFDILEEIDKNKDNIISKAEYEEYRIQNLYKIK